MKGSYDAIEKFFLRTVSKLIKDKNASILVVGGGKFEKEMLELSGYINVTISNLDERVSGDEFYPFKWKREHAEALSFENDHFDFVITHAVIHHASLPHKVLTEMYRVARKGVLAFEARDSLVMQLAQKLELTLSYEHIAVYNNDCTYGGVNNTEVPNYIYRWTEREIEKTIRSYAPYADHKITYKYATSFKGLTTSAAGSKMKYLLFKLVQPLFWIFTAIFPKQQNLFAFYIEKPALPAMLFPWLTIGKDKIHFNKEWGDKKYIHAKSNK